MDQQLKIILSNINQYPESEWIEFKENLSNREKIAETISALSNAACIKRVPYAYIIWWVDNQEKILKGTTLQIDRTESSNQQSLWFWLLNTFKEQITLELIKWRIRELDYFAIKIQAAQSWKPTVYKNISYVRILTADDAHNQNWYNYPHLLKEIYNNFSDISWEITSLKIEHLDIDAILKFRSVLSENPNNKRYLYLSDEELFRRLYVIKNWFVTYAWALLLAKEEYWYELFSDKNQITRKYEDKYNNISERKTRCTPFMICFDEITNEILRFNTNLAETTLFRKDLKQYEYKAIRELLFNSFIHRDWTINQRIEIKQSPKSIIFLNPGYFIADLDAVLKSNERPEYRNPTLSNIFKTLNYVEKEGWWLQDVFSLQMSKWLKIKPHFTSDKTSFELVGYIENIEFAQTILKFKTAIEPYDLILLDKIVSGKNSVNKDISIEDANRLELLWYIDISWTRYKVANLASGFAKEVNKIGIRTRIKWIKRDWYEEHIVSHIKKNGKIYPSEVKDICEWKPDHFAYNLLRSMRNKKTIKLIEVDWKQRAEWYHVLF